MIDLKIEGPIDVLVHRPLKRGVIFFLGDGFHELAPPVNNVSEVAGMGRRLRDLKRNQSVVLQRVNWKKLLEHRVKVDFRAPLKFQALLNTLIW